MRRNMTIFFADSWGMDAVQTATSTPRRLTFGFSSQSNRTNCPENTCICLGSKSAPNSNPLAIIASVDDSERFLCPRLPRPAAP
mmetsp:Transcript_4957/g.7957  ORF Transcript_4957/g.7957 Transcript_4957/m.7957 type:complete len:84 (+) Transcript_4957:1087-1338(+)